jgi:hypothetical protein
VDPQKETNVEVDFGSETPVGEPRRLRGATVQPAAMNTIAR